MLGLVVDGNTNKEQDEQQDNDEQYRTQLQQDVAATVRRARCRAPHGDQRRRCRWWRHLLPIIHQQLHRQPQHCRQHHYTELFPSLVKLTNVISVVKVPKTDHESQSITETKDLMVM